MSERTAFERLRRDPRFEALRLDTVAKQEEARKRVVTQTREDYVRTRMVQDGYDLNEHDVDSIIEILMQNGDITKQTPHKKVCDKVYFFISDCAAG